MRIFAWLLLISLSLGLTLSPRKALAAPSLPANPYDECLDWTLEINHDVIQMVKLYLNGQAIDIVWRLFYTVPLIHRTVICYIIMGKS